MLTTEDHGDVIMKMARDRLTSALEMARYRAAIHDIAHASNHDELMKAILKHKDVLRECM